MIKTEKNALDEGATLKEAYTYAYDEDFKDKEDRINRILNIICNACHVCKDSHTWHEYIYNYNRNSNHIYNDIHTIVKKFPLKNNNEYYILCVELKDEY